MRYTIKLQHTPTEALIKSETGLVDFNGIKLLPFEAAMMADALNECAELAEKRAELNVYAAKYAAKCAAARV